MQKHYDYDRENKIHALSFRVAQIFKLELRDLHKFENSIIRFTLSGLSVGTSTLLQAAIESWLKGFQYTTLTFYTRGFARPYEGQAASSQGCSKA